MYHEEINSKRIFLYIIVNFILITIVSFFLDVNECKKEVCKFPSLCRNTVGSYMCDCPDGYKLRGRKNSGRCVGKNASN